MRRVGDAGTSGGSGASRFPVRPGEGEARRRFAAARVARLATVRPGGAPHLIPVTFAPDGDMVWWAVDAKPKGTDALQRLRNVAHEPRVSLLVDHYDDDWSALWWVRADGTAAVIEGADAARGLELLAARYAGDAIAPPPGPVVAVTVTRWVWWAARPSPGWPSSRG